MVADPFEAFKVGRREVWPVARLVQALKDNSARLAQFRREYDALASQYFEGNAVRGDSLMTRATKL